VSIRRWGIAACAVAWLAGLALAATVPVAPWPALFVALALLATALGCSIGVWLLLIRRFISVPAALRYGLLAAWMLASAALGIARFAWTAPGLDPQNIANLRGQKITVRGVVSTDPVLYAKGESIAVSVSAVEIGNNTWQTETGTIAIYALGQPSEFFPELGDTVTAQGTVTPPSVYDPPGTDASLGAVPVTVIARGGGNPIWAALSAMRNALMGAITRALPAPEAALLIGILLGIKTPVLRSRLSLFTRTGTIHLVVTSGLKVTLVGAIVASLTRRLGRAVNLGASLGAIAIYVALTGAGPPAVRAGIMGALLVLARALRRDYDVFSSLGIAAILMTALTPATLWDVGFQLSAAGTLGIALWADRIAVPLTARIGRWSAGKALADAIATTIAAQIATLPLIAINFGIVSLVAPLANAVLVPFLPLFLALGALVGVAGIIAAPLGSIAGAIAWPVLRGADLLIAALAAPSWAALSIGALPAWITPVWIAGMSALSGLVPQPAREQETRRAGLPWQLRLGMAVTALLVLCTLAAGVTRAASTTADVTISFLDVPGGPATVVRLANGRTVLIDGGANGPALVTALAQVLPFWQRDIALVVVTDVRPGHLTGLISVLGSYHVGEVIDPGALHPDNSYIAWYTDVVNAHIPLLHVSQGTQIALGGGVLLSVLAPVMPLHDVSPQQDVNALVAMLEAPGLRVLFAGDAGDLDLARVMSYGGTLESDIVQICQTPNEGILTLTPLADLLALARPQLVVDAASARPAPKAGTPEASPTADDPAALLGASVTRTWQSGALTVAADASGWWIAQ
jgi:competence protein ComEC